MISLIYVVNRRGLVAYGSCGVVVIILLTVSGE